MNDYEVIKRFGDLMARRHLLEFDSPVLEPKVYNKKKEELEAELSNLFKDSDPQ